MEKGQTDSHQVKSQPQSSHGSLLPVDQAPFVSQAGICKHTPAEGHDLIFSRVVHLEIPWTFSLSPTTLPLSASLTLPVPVQPSTSSCGSSRSSEKAP